MKALIFLLSLLLILLLAGLWVGSGSYPQQWRLDQRTTAQEAENKQKKAEIKKIQAELDDVKSGDAAIEERARSELGMTGADETFFEVILQPDEKKPGQKNQSDNPSNNLSDNLSNKKESKTDTSASNKQQKQQSNSQ